jgi:hypothetical protein
MFACRVNADQSCVGEPAVRPPNPNDGVGASASTTASPTAAVAGSATPTPDCEAQASDEVVEVSESSSAPVQDADRGMWAGDTPILPDQATVAEEPEGVPEPVEVEDPLAPSLPEAEGNARVPEITGQAGEASRHQDFVGEASSPSPRVWAIGAPVGRVTQGPRRPPSTRPGDAGEASTRPRLDPTTPLVSGALEARAALLRLRDIMDEEQRRLLSREHELSLARSEMETSFLAEAQRWFQRKSDLDRREEAVRQREFSLLKEEERLDEKRQRAEESVSTSEMLLEFLQTKQNAVEAKYEETNLAMAALRDMAAARAAQEAELAVRESLLQSLQAETSARAAELKEMEQALHQREVDVSFRENEVVRQEEDLSARELKVHSDAAAIATWEHNLGDSVRREAESLTQALRSELDAAQKVMEGLQSARADEADLVWQLLGQLDSSLSRLGLPPVRPTTAPASVMEAAAVMNAAGVNLRGLEHAVSQILDAEGREVAQAAAAYVLTCIRSWDPDFSLEPVVRGPVAAREAAAAESVQEVAKEVASRFHSGDPAGQA